MSPVLPSVLCTQHTDTGVMWTQHERFLGQQALGLFGIIKELCILFQRQGDNGRLKLLLVSSVFISSPFIVALNLIAC